MSQLPQQKSQVLAALPAMAETPHHSLSCGRQKQKSNKNYDGKDEIGEKRYGAIQNPGAAFPGIGQVDVHEPSG
jgi:hypothetical protein